MFAAICILTATRLARRRRLAGGGCARRSWRRALEEGSPLPGGGRGGLQGTRPRTGHYKKRLGGPASRLIPAAASALLANDRLRPRAQCCEGRRNQLMPHDGECIEKQKEKCSSLGPRGCLWLLCALQAMLGVEISAVDANVTSCVIQ
eukprot:1183522-Prorocentrum_minimum.AAC.5